MSLCKIKISEIWGELSDLFFNHEHPHYDALYFDGKETKEEAIKCAIYLDAHEFVESFPYAAEGYTGEELAEDFLLRM